MPVLDDDGFVLWESNAIMQYLASKMPAVGLWPSDPRRQADVSRWQCWELAHWDPACATLIFERFVKRLAGQGDPDPAQVARGEASFQEFATVLDGHLRRRDWLVDQSLACRHLGRLLVHLRGARRILDRRLSGDRTLVATVCSSCPRGSARSSRRARSTRPSRHRSEKTWPSARGGSLRLA